MLSTVRRLGVRGPAVVAIFLIGLFAIGCSGAALQGVGAPGATAAPGVATGDAARGPVEGDQNGSGNQPPAAPADVLTKVRGQIEEMTAEKGPLVEQAAMSTLTVTFSLKPNPVRTEQQGFDPAAEAEQASASLVSVLQGVATAGIWFGIVWLPILLFFGIVAGVVLVVSRRFRRAGPGDDTPPVAPEAG